MSSQLRVTQSGIARIANASSGGFLLNLNKFKVTEQTNFVPGEALLGTVTYEGSIVSIESLNAGLIKFTLDIPGGIPLNNAVWNLGELGLFHEDGTLFAHGVLDPVYEKRAELGLRIHAFISQSSAGEVVNASIATVNSIPSYPFTKNLPNPELLGENAILVLDGNYNDDDSNSPTLATRYGPGGALWGFEGYTRVFSGLLQITSQSEVSFASQLQFLNNEVTLFHVTSGSGVGQTRRMKYNGVRWIELDGKAFTLLDGTSRIAVWRNPVSIVKALQQQVLNSLNTGTRYASIDEYNSVVTQLNTLMGTPSGVYPDNFGYGQQNLPLLVSPNYPTLANWTTVIDAIKLCALHQGKTIGAITNDDFTLNNQDTRGLYNISKNYASLVAGLNSGTQFKDSVALTSLSSNVPPTGTVSRTSSWINQVVHEILFTFQSSDSMKAYFNSGGKISTFASLENGIDQHDNEWHQFLNNLGNVVLSSSEIKSNLPNTSLTPGGFYNLTTSFVEIFKTSFTGISGHPVTYRLSGRLENSNTQLRLSVVFSEANGVYTGAYGSSASNNGTLTSSVCLYKSNLLNLPTIPYPSVVSSGTL